MYGWLFDTKLPRGQAERTWVAKLFICNPTPFSFYNELRPRLCESSREEHAFIMGFGRMFTFEDFYVGRKDLRA